MYTIQPKKLLIINILDILQKRTDENHKLSQRQIEDILEKDYMMKVDRKAVRRNLIDLVYSDYVRIGYTEIIRKNRNKRTGELHENNILTDFYLIRDFTPGELRYLVDSVLSSRYIKDRQGRDLITKIEALGGVFFHSHTKNILRNTGSAVYSGELFYNIEQLDEAINCRNKVRFKYSYFGEDKKVHLKTCEDGSVREYIISPYQMAVNDGKYYLICNYDKYDDISHYRIDRIRDVEILDESAKPFKKLKEASGKGLNLNEYMDSHIYMFSDIQQKVKFKAAKGMVGDIIDVFGQNINITGKDEKYITVSAKVSVGAMLQYAKAFAPDVIVLEPKDLAEKVKQQLEETVRLYGG